MSLQAHISADIFLHLPLKKSPTTTTTKNTLVFFIPGNPGLLGYYHEFFSLLATSPLNTLCIAAFSLGGFEISSSTTPAPLARIQHPERAPPGHIYSLAEQIDLTHRRVRSLVEALQPCLPLKSPQRHPSHYDVILLGHSVGAYIALEVIRRLHVEHSRLGPDQVPLYAVTGAVLLTPTIVDIAKSRQGAVVAPLLRYVPALDRLAQWAAWGLNALPGAVLEGLVGRMTGLKGEKLRTTVEWSGSRRGVRQTVKMGGEEMREIGGDKWGEEVWGVEGEGHGDRTGRRRWKAPKLVLYFAGEDHWVDNLTRQVIVNARRRTGEEGTENKSWPRIEVGEIGELVHGWCIEQSREVAEKVIEWIEEIME